MEWVSGYNKRIWRLFTSLSNQIYYICINEIISFEFIEDFQENDWVKLKVNCTHGVTHEITYENKKKAVEAFNKVFKSESESEK